MNIKTIIASSLMLMHPAYTISSEQESINTSISENFSHPLSLPEVAITITSHSDLLEIIRLSATNKTFRNFLKEQAVTERILTQIISLYHYNLIFDYQNSLIGNLDTITTTVSSETGIEILTRDTQENRNNLLINNLKSFLHEGECDFFNQALIEGFLLIDIMKQCQKIDNWETCINKLTELDKTKLPRYLAHFYCKGKYNDYDVVKTLLIEALCLQAPQEVIDILIKWGSRLTSIKAETPPPCFILFESLRTKTTEQDIELLKQRIDQLIEKGANFDDHCYMPSTHDNPQQTPLWLAIVSDDVELMKYALERSSQNAINTHLDLVFSFIARIKPDILNSLIRSAQGTIINEWLSTLITALIAKAVEDVVGDVTTLGIDFLKLIALEKSICLPQKNGKDATSVYQFIVNMLHTMKSLVPYNAYLGVPYNAYLAMEKKIIFIFEELAKAGAEDKAEGNSKLAIHLAQEYDLPEIVNCLRNSLYSKD